MYDVNKIYISFHLCITKNVKSEFHKVLNGSNRLNWSAKSMPPHHLPCSVRGYWARNGPSIYIGRPNASCQYGNWIGRMSAACHHLVYSGSPLLVRQIWDHKGLGDHLLPICCLQPSLFVVRAFHFPNPKRKIFWETRFQKKQNIFHSDDS